MLKIINTCTTRHVFPKPSAARKIFQNFPLQHRHPYGLLTKTIKEFMFGSWSPCQWKIVTASVLVKKAAGLCTLTGLLCASSSTMIISIWDSATDNNDANATKVVDQITMVAGNPYPIPAKLNKGLYIQVVSGSGSITVFYD